MLHDIEILKQKVDAGATRAITQFFFDNSAYFRFLDVAAAAGLDVPIVPGIFPVQNFKQTANFARRTGTSVPRWLADRFEGLEDDAATRRLVAAAVCAEQVIDLIDHGVEELHFYTMNRADLVFAICHFGRPARHARAARSRTQSDKPATRCGRGIGISGRARPLLTTPIAGRQAALFLPMNRVELAPAIRRPDRRSPHRPQSRRVAA